MQNNEVINTRLVSTIYKKKVCGYNKLAAQQKFLATIFYQYTTSKEDIMKNTEEDE